MDKSPNFVQFCTAYTFARQLVTDDTAVKVKVYEAALFAVVAKVVTQQFSLSTQQYDQLASVLQEMSFAYVKLNPTLPQDPLANNFLDHLWRIQNPHMTYRSSKPSTAVSQP